MVRRPAAGKLPSSAPAPVAGTIPTSSLRAVGAMAEFAVAPAAVAGGRAGGPVDRPHCWRRAGPVVVDQRRVRSCPLGMGSTRRAGWAVCAGEREDQDRYAHGEQGAYNG